jgi:hypothetical protein
MGNDPEIKFQGTKSLIFQEVERMLRRLKVSFSIRSKVRLGKSRGLVVKGEDSQLSGCGFEPRHLGWCKRS